MDLAQERARGCGQMGTTGRGIGPAYTDKTSRNGLRMEEMLDLATFLEKVMAHTRRSTKLHALYHADPLDAVALADEFEAYARTMAPYICDLARCWIPRCARASGCWRRARRARCWIWITDVPVCHQFHTALARWLGWESASHRWTGWWG